MAEELTLEEQRKLAEALIKNDQLDPADAAGSFERPPLGQYLAQLTNLEDKTDRKQAPILFARFDLKKALGADNKGGEGMDAVDFYSLVASPPKRKGGKMWAPGYIAMYAAMAAVNGSAPADRPHIDAREDGTFWFNSIEMKKIYAKYMGKKLIHIALYEETYTDKESGEEKKVTKIKVIGPAPGANGAALKSAPAAAPAEEDLI